MSMYRPYSNIAFNNCYDFIMKSKAEKEVWELSTSLTFGDKEEMRWELDRISDLAENIMNAEYDLMEMEMEALYDAEEYDSIMNENTFRTSKRASRRKQNKKNKSRDRIHGRRHGGAHGGVDFRYVDCNPFCTKDSYYDGMHKDNGKRHNNAKKLFSVIAREKEDARLFTGIGELLEDIAYLEDKIYIYEENIKDLEYEKAFGYLTPHGEEFLEDYKKELEELKEYKQYKEVLLRTATR